MIDEKQYIRFQNSYIRVIVLTIISVIITSVLIVYAPRENIISVIVIAIGLFVSLISSTAWVLHALLDVLIKKGMSIDEITDVIRGLF